MPLGTLFGHVRLAAFDGAVHTLAAHRLVEIDLMPVELRAIHAGKARLAPTVTRQAPHIPVPSTISVLRLTIVLIPYLSVVCATNFIIIIGPMAITSS